MHNFFRMLLYRTYFVTHSKKETRNLRPRKVLHFLKYGYSMLKMAVVRM